MRTQATLLTAALLLSTVPTMSQQTEEPAACVSEENLSVKPLSAARRLGTPAWNRSLAATDEAPLPVRHDVAQPDEGLLTLRYWRLRRGSYDEFWRLSSEGLWPFFEKIGARIVGTWRVVVPPGGEEAGMLEHPDYEEVYMLVRYTSFEHWQATRNMARLGGNGPDFEKARAASLARRPMVLESWVTFLQGHQWHGGPVFTPPLEERYVLEE